MYQFKRYAKVNELLSIQVRCPNQVKIVTYTSTDRVTESNRYRKLLVRFKTENDDSTVIRYAKSLRISTDKFISQNVYINPDLSVVEAKSEYDKRVARRA